MMRILGIDPGVATVGFGVLDIDGHRQSLVTCGVMTTSAGQSLAARLDLLYNDTIQIIDTFKPGVMAVEELFFNTNLKTGIAVAHARGVILLAGHRALLPVFEYTPLQVKQAVAGYGRAQKKQVIEMVRRLLKLESAPKPDDAADAVAIALCHARSATSLLMKNRGGDKCSTT